MASEWHWQGASGVWYRHSIWVFPGSLLTVPANYIAVRRGQDGTRRAIYIGESENLNRRWGDHAASGLLDKALALGANEIHIHFWARDGRERAAIETDLLHAQHAPLNGQPAPRRYALAPSQSSDPAAADFADADAFAMADPIVELANLLNARSASTGRQTPIWAER